VVARTAWRVECPKVANVIVALVEAVRSNHQLSSKVGNVLAKLLRIGLDGDELFRRCKDLQEEKKELGWQGRGCGGGKGQVCQEGGRSRGPAEGVVVHAKGVRAVGC